MASITADRAKTSLQILAELATERQHELQNYSDPVRPPSDDDNGTDAPIFDQYYNAHGSQGTVEMINFDPLQFQSISAGFETFTVSNYNIGRGRKSQVTAKEMLCMTMTVLKHGGDWAFLGNMFNLKGPTMERMIWNFVDLICDPFYEKYVRYHSRKWTMRQLSEKKRCFANYPMARYATDVTFQPSYRPSGSVQKGKRYYSGKHKMCGYKMEVSVLPIGLAIGSSEHEPGSVSDLDMFQQMQRFHSSNLQKREDEEEFEDDGPLAEEFPNSWAVLADKGYQGSTEFCRVVHPSKKPHNGALTPAQIATNRHISSDRVVVENCFGRLCGMWTVLGKKWKWAEARYDGVFRLCLALTNYHVKCNPLSADDGVVFRQTVNLWYSIGLARHEKKRTVQRNYREKRQRHMNVMFRASAVPEYPECQPSDDEV